MPGFLLHVGAKVICMHSGQAQPVTSNHHVKVSGQEVVTQSNNYSITGCTLPPPTSGNGPCASAQWVTAATRVKANEMPVLLKDSQATCTPSGTGLNVLVTQNRVRGI